MLNMLKKCEKKLEKIKEMLKKKSGKKSKKIGKNQEKIQKNNQKKKSSGQETYSIVSCSTRDTPLFMYNDFDHSTRPHLTLIAKRAFFRRSNLVPTVFSSPFPLSLLCLLSRYFTFLKFTYCEKATKFVKTRSKVLRS